MPLKRPVTLPQARRWPAAAKRRQSFCARMGGMRELLTGERAARDPASPINRALAAWDCDEPELLRREHVSKEIRMKITKGKVGSEVRKENPPIGVKWLPKKGKPKITYAILPKTSAGRGIMLGEFSTKARAEEYMRSLTSPWNYRIKKIEEYEYEEPPEENPARKNPAPAKRIKTRPIIRVDPKTGQAIGTEFVPIDFDFRAYIGGIQYDFFARTEGAQLIISERTTGAKVGAVPFTTRSAALNDREAAKLYLSSVIERVGADKFKAAIEKAPKVSP